MRINHFPENSFVKGFVLIYFLHLTNGKYKKCKTKKLTGGGQAKHYLFIPYFAGQIQYEVELVTTRIPIIQIPPVIFLFFSYQEFDTSNLTILLSKHF